MKSDGAEMCELVEIYILSCSSTIIDKNDCNLYRDDRLLVLLHVHLFIYLLTLFEFGVNPSSYLHKET